MRLTKIFPSQTLSKIATTPDVHQLLAHGGFLRLSASGIYSFLPMGLRILDRIQNIIHQELAKINGQQVILPTLLHSSRWKKTGRWNSGFEMIKIKDRRGTEFCLGPTHEEEITSMFADENITEKHLPLKLYQIEKKYRDEYRPRGGLLRCREFIMKDMYSFDKSEQDAMESYRVVSAAYSRIFKRIGLPFVVAEADTGSIGGTMSHEYHYLSPAGEDDVLTCNNCGYAANSESATRKIDLPDRLSVEIKEEEQAIKLLRENASILYSKQNSDYTMFVIGKHRHWNTIQLNKFTQTHGISLKLSTSKADENQVMHKEDFGRVTCIVFDDTVRHLHNTMSGFLSNSFFKVHLINASVAEAGDACERCNTSDSFTHKLSSSKAIEVGHTFFLGSKYSEPLNALVQAGPKRVYAQMGCYGIGVSRLISAIAEVNRDDKGLVWPWQVAPFQCVLIPSNKKNISPDSFEKVYQVCKSILGADRVLLDDREHPFGYKIKDSEFLGYPLAIVVGASYENSGKLEVIDRKSFIKQQLTISQLVEYLKMLDSNSKTLE